MNDDTVAQELFDRGHLLKDRGHSQQARLVFPWYRAGIMQDCDLDCVESIANQEPTDERLRLHAHKHDVHCAVRSNKVGDSLD